MDTVKYHFMIEPSTKETVSSWPYPTERVACSEISQVLIAEGTMTFITGESFTGEWKANKPHGEGRYNFDEKTMYQVTPRCCSLHHDGECIRVSGGKDSVLAKECRFGKKAIGTKGNGKMTV